MADLYRAPDGQTWVLDSTGGKGSQIAPEQVAQAQQRAKEIPVNAADAEKPGENHPRVMTAPEGWVLDERPPTLQHQTRKISGWESAARGAAQGVTLGWSDELEAAIGNPFDVVGELTRGSTYQTRLADARRENRNASLQNPWSYGVSEFAGGAAVPIPGGAAGRSLASTGRAAAVGAGVGATAGVGYSERPGLEALKDAALPAALGAGGAGLAHHVVSGAPERVVSRTMGDITDGATAAMRDKTAGVAGKNVNEVFDLVQQTPGIKKHAWKSASKAADAAQEKIDQVGAKLDDIYDRVDAAGPALKVSDVLGAIEAVKKKIANDPGKRQIAASIEQRAMDVLEMWGGQEYVPTRAVRRLQTDLGELAFAGNIAIPPKTAKMYAQQVYGSLGDLISGHVTNVAKILPEQGLDLAALKKLNRDMHNLVNIRDALNYRASRYATPSTRLKDQLGGVTDMALIATAPTAYFAKKAGETVGIRGVRTADSLMATLVNAARKGSTPAQVGQLALELGISQQIGEQIGRWAQEKFVSAPNPTLQQTTGAE